ncbi:MAG: ankyrin repeat domain-containing protein [Gammaproteobacteria bacterium]|nr:ankyrin repeat domain-containing protein [Gammaproteobacteria bacterium]MDH5729720.1 ankyrin repeat domain-containing protein [Gammaproteobacteria bacterium]
MIDCLRLFCSLDVITTVDNPKIYSQKSTIRASRLLLLIAGLMLIAQPTWSSALEDGQNAARKGDYAQAASLWKPLASAGNANAQYFLARLYRNGRGVEKNLERAFDWFLKAAEQGHARAQYNVGFMYQLGKGRAKDLEEAKRWYQKAAEQGDSVAQTKLKQLNQEGMGLFESTSKKTEALSPNQALLIAAARGAINSVVHLVENGAAVNSHDPFGFTPIMLATVEGHTELVKTLIQLKADIELSNNGGDTAITLASRFNYPAIVRVLLDIDANTNHTNKNGDTALHIAVMQGHEEVIKMLANNKKVNINAREQMQRSPLILATIRGDTSTVELLIRLGANPNLMDKHGFTALHIAAREGRTATARALLNGGAQPDTKQKTTGDTALILAAKFNRSSTLRALTKAGANPNKLNDVGNAAIHIAATQGHLNIVKDLCIYNKTHLEIRNPVDMTPLMLAAAHEQTKIVRELLRANAKVDATTHAGWTALMFAADRGNTAAVKQLLRRGANPNQDNQEGWNTLMLAARKGNAAMIKLLLDTNANINAKNRLGETALFIATKSGNIRLTELLISAGATPIPFKLPRGEI